MHKDNVDYKSEFDSQVTAYNQLLGKSETPGKRVGIWHNLVDGLSSVLSIVANPSDYSSYRTRMVTGSKDRLRYETHKLTPQQIDAVMCASELKRVGKHLDDIIEGNVKDGEISVDDAKQGKLVVEQMNNNLMEMYIAYARK